MNLSYQNFSKMFNNETKGIKFENIELLCEILDCTPSVSFSIEQSK